MFGKHLSQLTLVLCFLSPNADSVDFSVEPSGKWIYIDETKCIPGLSDDEKENMKARSEIEVSRSNGFHAFR